MSIPFSMDFSQDKPDIREVIPAGTVVFVEMVYRPGGANLPNTPTEHQEGALKAAKPPSDALYLDCEFTILLGPYKGRKFWSNITVAGGKVDEKGRSIAAGIARQTIRCILDSSQGLSSKDESPEATAKRVMRGFRDLQKRRFMCKLKVEKSAGYADKNGLGQVLTVDMKDYPKSEAELNNVPSAKVKDAPAAPTWGDQAQQAPQQQPQPAAAPAPAGAWVQPSTPGRVSRPLCRSPKPLRPKKVRSPGGLLLDIVCVHTYFVGVTAATNRGWAGLITRPILHFEASPQAKHRGHKLRDGSRNTQQHIAGSPNRLRQDDHARRHRRAPDQQCPQRAAQ